MQKDQTQNQLNYIPSKYSRSLNNFSKTEIPSITPLISAICKTCEYGSRFPVFKVLKAIIKLFMLNEIEVIFIGYLIKETRWNIHEKTIFYNYSNVGDLICVSIDNSDYKMLTLYLMVVGYTVKFYLNDQKDLEDFGYIEEANKICPNFKVIFETWAKNYSDITMRISPKTLNKIYIQLYSSSRNQQSDFNRLVDAIMQISPAYNAGDKSNQHNNTHTSKKITTQKNANLPQKQKQQPEKNIGGIPQKNLLFSSSGIFKIMNPTNTSSGVGGFYNYNNNDNMGSYVNPFLQMKSNRYSSIQHLGLMGSSLVGMPNNYSMKDDEQECQQLMLGLEEGQSQDNIMFESGYNGQRQNYQHDGPITSVITLSRGNSFSQKGSNHSQIQLQKASGKQMENE